MTAPGTASIAVLLILASTYACEGAISWRTIYSSQSPDGEAIVLLQLRNCLGDCVSRIVVRDR